VVSPASGSGNKDSLRLLNYLTAPNVLVWSASLASCAIPGIYAPVELLKKDENGKLSPYMEGGAPIKWEDGSVQADLPMQRLSELFNINHFIASQCLLNGTKVVMADGSLKTCETVEKDDKLLGHRGEFVTVSNVVPNQPRDEVISITHEDGSVYTVSSEHRVTVRCNANPCVSITQRRSGRWQMRLAYMSSAVKWTRINWRAQVLQEEEEEEDDQMEEDDEEEEDNQASVHVRISCS
jgi:predicted acylesterase/phospholipase RssA